MGREEEEEDGQLEEAEVEALAPESTSNWRVKEMAASWWEVMMLQSSWSPEDGAGEGSGDRYL